jgi:SET domain-containing protein
MLSLGLGRFVNHNCNANTSFQADDAGKVHFYAIRDIKAKEEITVSYGAEYFKDENGNSYCLCATCKV